jgi:calcium-dependent protein kinase
MMEKKALKIKKELFISSSKTKNIKDDYEYVRELGSGGYGVVFLAQHRVTGNRPSTQASDEQ